MTKSFDYLFCDFATATNALNAVLELAYCAADDAGGVGWSLYQMG